MVKRQKEYVITCPVQCVMKLLFHSQTSKVVPLKLGNKYVLPPHILYVSNERDIVSSFNTEFWNKIHWDFIWTTKTMGTGFTSVMGKHVSYAKYQELCRSTLTPKCYIVWVHYNHVVIVEQDSSAYAQNWQTIYLRTFKICLHNMYRMLIR